MRISRETKSLCEERSLITYTTKMKSILLFSFLPYLALAQSSDYDYESYSYDYDDYVEIDDCNFYDTEHAEQCQHGNFPAQQLEEVFGTGNVHACCGEHGYVFRDNCEV